MTGAATTELTAQQLWDQEAAKREGSTAPAADAASTVTDPKPAVEANDGDESGNQTKGATGAPAGDDTATDNVGDGKKDDQPDVMAQILEKLEKLEGRQRNVEGHIGGLKTAQQSLHAAMESARKQSTETSTDAPTKSAVAAAATNPQKWEELKKDFPEWAEATEELLGARLATLQTPSGGISQEQVDKLIDERITQVSASLREEMVNEHLNEILPDWKEEVKTPAFNTWLQAQPKSIQDLASSSKVSDASKMLRLFDASRTTADPAVEIRNDRKQKLDAATALPKVGAAPKAKSVDDMTPEEVWEHEAKKREQARAQRGY
jgi:hypothetical protein